MNDDLLCYAIIVENSRKYYCAFNSVLYTYIKYQKVLLLKIPELCKGGSECTKRGDKKTQMIYRQFSSALLHFYTISESGKSL